MAKIKCRVISWLLSQPPLRQGILQRIRYCGLVAKLLEFTPDQQSYARLEQVALHDNLEIRILLRAEYGSKLSLFACTGGVPSKS